MPAPMPAPQMAAPPMPAAAPRLDAAGPTLAAALASLLLIAAIAVWAQVTMISGAVIAPGQVVVRGKPKLVQSLDGGIVAAIGVANGDVVAGGALLMRLDPTLLEVTRDIARNRLAAALALAARLRAEQMGATELSFTYPDLPFAALDRADTAREEEGQRQIFAARAELLKGRRDQLAEQRRKLEVQAEGLEGLIAAKAAQLALLGRERANVQRLYERSLARQGQLLDLQRAEADLLGQLSGYRSDLAATRLAARDAELAVVQGEREFKEQVVTDLRLATTEAEELVLQIVNLGTQLDRVDIRAPSPGVVHELQATTVGGVVAPGAVLLQILPVDDGMAFEFRLDPRAVNRVQAGQPAQVVFPAFDQRITPKLNGTVAAVSPAAIADPASGQSYYRVELEIAADEIARLGPGALLPGMPLEAFLQTGERSVLGYLLDPLSAQIDRAFREI
jgi:HlyD family secretion protein